MMKRFLTALLLLVATVAVHAVPADPSVWRIFKTADGKTVRVQLCGDEFMRYWKAENGACYTLESNDVLRVADMQQLQLNASIMRSQMEPVVEREGGTACQLHRREALPHYPRPVL